VATVTTNFNFPIPQSTDLVKDGATAIAALGTSVDTQFVDLKGGTTGQVLAKASNTDLDYSWVTTDDANAIQNSIVDAKGDLIAATANDTPARLPVGGNGSTLVADSTESTGLRWTTRIGSNCVINGAFDYWQRGTSFNIAAYTPDVFSADRWLGYAGSGTATMSRQTLTAGDIVSDWSQYYLQYQQTVSAAGVGTPALYTRIEDVRTLAGQTTTISFWAKAASAATITADLNQNFGSGGSSTVTTNLGSFSVTTSWARYTATVTTPSITGKTIGANNFLSLQINMPSTGTFTLGFANVQVEIGHVASNFSRAGGTLQGELAACQRYYYRYTGSSYLSTPMGLGQSSTAANIPLPNPTTLRTVATSVGYTGGGVFSLNDSVNSITFTSASIDAGRSTPQVTWLALVVSGATAFRPYWLQAGNNSSAYIEISAEL
jgi:hypothetical protein